MKRKINNILLLISVAGLLLVSCGNNITYTESYPMADNTWRLMDIKSFNAQITDTAVLNNMFFTIRTGTDYPFRNIFLFASISLPDGTNLTDTLEYSLADDKGNWLGSGFGDVRELKLPYRYNVYFPERGEYIFEVRHGMRVEDLKGVYDFGLRIENTGK